MSRIPGALNVAPKPGVEMSRCVSDVAEIERVVQDKTAAIILYCNGPFCGKSERLSRGIGRYRFYQCASLSTRCPDLAGTGGLTQIELDGARYVLAPG